MATVILFHHAQGLTPGVQEFGEELRQAGHNVHTPDLYGGRTFASLDNGIAHAREVGFAEVLQRGVAAAEGLASPGAVFAGFSLGVMPAQKLSQTHPDALGAVLIDACLPVSEFGDRWPDNVPVQLHGRDADPFYTEEGGDLDAARSLTEATAGAELFLYPGDQHIFADSSLPSYDQAAAALLVERGLGFLEQV